MTLEFSVGDAIKYQVIIDGSTILIHNLPVFLKDWKTFKEKAEKYNYGIQLRTELLEKAKTINRFGEIDDALFLFSQKILEHQTIAETEIAYQRKLNDKLEAAKTHFENRPKSMVGPPLRSNIASIGYDDKAVHKWFQEFKALLGVEE